MIPLLAFASAAWRTRIVLVGIVLVLTVAAALAGQDIVVSDKTGRVAGRIARDSQGPAPTTMLLVASSCARR